MELDEKKKEEDEDDDLLIMHTCMDTVLSSSITGGSVERPRITPRSSLLTLVFENEGTYRELCRLSPQEARDLCERCGVDWEGREQHFKLTNSERFTVFLLTMADNLRYARLRGELSWAKGSVASNLAFWALRVCATLNAADSVDRIAGWNAEEVASFRASNPPAPGKSCIGIVDAGRFFIEAPQHHRDRFYDDYTKAYALNVIFIIDRRGRYRWLGGPFLPGNTSETTCLSTMDVQLPHDIHFLADGAYINNQRCVVPFPRSQQGTDLSLDLSSTFKRAFNKALRRVRVLVEHAIGSLKMTWPLLHGEFRMTLEKLHPLVLAGALMLNYAWRVRGRWPINDPDFVPGYIPVQELDWLEV
jgi:hypothetical protein